MNPSNSVGFVILAIPCNQNSQVQPADPQQTSENDNLCKCRQIPPSIFYNQNFGIGTPSYNPIAENHKLQCLNSALSGKFARLAITTNNPEARDYFFSQAVSSMRDTDFLAEAFDKCDYVDDSFKIGFLQNISPAELRSWDKIRQETFQPLQRENCYNYYSN